MVSVRLGWGEMMVRWGGVMVERYWGDGGVMGGTGVKFYF